MGTRVAISHVTDAIAPKGNRVGLAALESRPEEGDLYPAVGALRHNGPVDSVAQLLIYGSGGKAAHVTASLGIAPTRCVEAGDPVRHGSSKIAENSGWILDSEVEGPGVEVDDSIRALLHLIEPKSPSLWQLEREGYVVVWRCVAATNDLEHDIEIDRETLRRLVALPGVLRLDVYDDGSLLEGTGDLTAE